MNDALTLLFSIFTGFLNTIFSMYLFNGVSLGMVFVVIFMFTIIFTYLLAVPNIRIVGGRSKSDKKTDSSTTSNSNS